MERCCGLGGGHWAWGTGHGALGVVTEPAQAAAEEGVAPSPNYTPLGLPWQFLSVIV